MSSWGKTNKICLSLVLSFKIRKTHTRESTRQVRTKRGSLLSLARIYIKIQSSR